MPSYWSQWNSEEIKDLHGIEDEDKDGDEDLCDGDIDTSLSYYEINKCDCRNGCSYCLL